MQFYTELVVLSFHTCKLKIAVRGVIVKGFYVILKKEAVRTHL